MGILFIGSLIVIYIGIGLIKAKGSLNSSTDVDIPLIKVLTTACVVTWFNPQAIIDGSMMLGAFRASLPPENGIKFISGVAFASCMWFIGMTIFITCFSSKITEKVLRIINIACGTVIIFYGIKLFYSFIQMVI